jgi:hypothetical protein
MAEERTVSNFTKINTPDCANQKAGTIINITKVKQHIRQSWSKVHTLAITSAILLMTHLQRSPRPVVRFCDLSKYCYEYQIFLIFLFSFSLFTG